uniref:Uncharacterized protein n=1 Tax=Lotus japonicus TaxID=34305 RepID=I3SWZ6_LOTJA|nr:unknown [Lotus japonicus]
MVNIVLYRSHSMLRIHSMQHRKMHRTLIVYLKYSLDQFRERNQR